MKIIFYLFALLIFASSAFAQKGIDKQTEKIREEGNQTTRRNDVGRAIDFGSGKTPTRNLLANPYKLNARRDILVNAVINVLKEQQIIVDESASRLNEGIIVTQPYVFAKGAVITPSELARYAILPNSDTIFTRGRYTLTIEVQPIDGIQNNVSVLAKVEGRAENGLISEWTTLQSRGIAEDEFLAKLIEAVTGTTPIRIVETQREN